MSLSNQLGITSDQIVSTMWDRASVVNNVAIQTIYPHHLDVGCFSNTTDHIGKKIKTDILDKFAGLDCPHAVQRQDWLGRKVQVCQSLHTQPLDGGQNGGPETNYGCLWRCTTFS